MARALTTEQKNLLRSSELAVHTLATFFLDSGTYRFCDDVHDLSDGTNTYIGASALAGGVEVRAARPLASEPLTLIIDGNRMSQFGISDPAAVLRDMLDELIHQRRVNLALGFHYNYNQDINLVIPIYAGKINYAKLIDAELSLTEDKPVEAKLEIVIDSLAMRYTRATFRTRSHNDQLEIDTTDNFYSFVADAAQNEKRLYWGKDAPYGSSSSYGGGNSYGGSGNFYDRFNVNFH
jgi:hypothetical protein